MFFIKSVTFQKTMKPIWLKVISGIALWVLLYGMAFADTQMIVAEGMSDISFDAALRDAQRAAVEQGAGTFIHSQTEIDNFTVNKDKIISRTDGYIQGFEFLEKKQENGLFMVKIQAKVALEMIKNDMIALKILLDAMERPKLMVLVEESYTGLDFQKMTVDVEGITKKPVTVSMGPEGMRIAETEMISVLQGKGFEIVDRDQLEAANQMDQAKQALAGNDSAAEALGLKFGAQYVIIGKAVCQNVGEVAKGSGFLTVQASLQLKILHSQSGLYLGSVVKQGTAAHLSELGGATEALKNVAKQAVETYITDQIMTSFQDFLNNGIPLKINIVGVKSFTQYREIVSVFETMPQVSSCKKEGWNKAGGLLVLDLRYKGTTEELATQVDQKSVGTGKLSVEDFAPDKLDLALN